MGVGAGAGEGEGVDDEGRTRLPNSPREIESIDRARFARSRRGCPPLGVGVRVRVRVRVRARVRVTVG